METIEVYHSVWRMSLLIIVCFAFAAIGVFMLFRGEMAWFDWIGIIFFGGGGLFMTYLVLREFLTRTPYYIITDEGVEVNSGIRNWEVRFADVESFFLTKVATTKMVGIQYKPDAERKKMDESNSVSRSIRKMNSGIAGSAEALPADDLSLKPQQFCDLLNSRLKNYKDNRFH